jgi:hypothetical protein
MAGEEKARENRLRRAAKRQGLRLVKSRRRDPLAVGYGLYWVVATDGDALLPDQAMNLDAVEAHLLPSLGAGDTVMYQPDETTSVLATVLKPVGGGRYLIQMAPSGPRSALPPDVPADMLASLDQTRALIADLQGYVDPQEPFEVDGEDLVARDW